MARVNKPSVGTGATASKVRRKVLDIRLADEEPPPAPAVASLPIEPPTEASGDTGHGDVQGTIEGDGPASLPREPGDQVEQQEEDRQVDAGEEDEFEDEFGAFRSPSGVFEALPEPATSVEPLTTAAEPGKAKDPATAQEHGPEGQPTER